jgi:hypothetical protein
MNEKNYDYLKSQIKFLGFGENLQGELMNKIKEQPEAFSLNHQVKFGADEVSSKLNFTRSKESDLYFFNSFDLSLKKPGNEQELKQSYYVGKENNFTLKERYNLLDGRAVFKEFNRLELTGEGKDAKFRATDETYKAWTDLNFKDTDQQGNFLPKKMYWDHEKELSKYPVKELENNYDKTRLLAAMEKGNYARATVVKNGQEVNVLVSANPRQTSLDFYDQNMQRVSVGQVNAQELKQNNSLEQPKEGQHNKQAENQQDQALKNQQAEKPAAAKRQGQRI